MPLEVIIEKLTSGKSIFELENQTLAEGQKANITLFNPDGKSTFTEQNILSKSKNSAFLNQKLKGKVYGIYNQNQLILS